MKPNHSKRLLINYALGTLIKFGQNLSVWQKSQSTTKNQSYYREQLPTTSNLNTPASLETSDNSYPIQACQKTVLQVDSVLSNSTDGLLIINYFKSHGEFNDNIRGKLVDLIIHNLIANKIPMSITLADNIANQIVFMFPSEIKVGTYLVYKKINLNE